MNAQLKNALSIWSQGWCRTPEELSAISGIDLTTLRVAMTGPEWHQRVPSMPWSRSKQELGEGRRRFSAQFQALLARAAQAVGDEALNMPPSELCAALADLAKAAQLAGLVEKEAATPMVQLSIGALHSGEMAICSGGEEIGLPSPIQTLANQELELES